jgi:hypothetical protein
MIGPQIQKAGQPFLDLMGFLSLDHEAN